MITPEPLTEQQSLGFLPMAVGLLIRVDNMAPINLIAGVYSAQNSLMVSARIEKEHIEQVSRAKNRISIAIKIEEDIFHERQFLAINVRSTVGKLLDECQALSGAR